MALVAKAVQLVASFATSGFIRDQRFQALVAKAVRLLLQIFIYSESESER
jgi:hypothetical protein